MNFNARVSSEFTPATDNTYDLGRTGHEWRDLYINGTANIDSLVADTADVNGGTIDGATIGASTASSGAFTTLSASDDANFDSGTLFVDASADSVGIGTTSPSAKLDVNGNAAVTGEVTSTASLRTTGAEAANLTASASLGYIAGDGKGRLLVQGPDASTDGSLRIRLTRSDASNSIAVADFTTTGLAVTGALSATGLITSSTGNSTPAFTANGATTGWTAATFINSGGTSYFGTEASVGGTLVTGSTAYDALIRTHTGLSISTNGGNGTQVRVSSTGLAVTGDITATGNITAYYSDDRLKTKLGNIENALDKVSKLNGFYYEANETAQALGYKPVREVGLSAQQVEAVLPEVVAPAPIDNEYKTLHYERVIPLLVEAIKELKAEIELLKK